MNPTPTLHFFCGKAGAGKSTVAARIAREHGAILISEDIWLARLFGDQMKAFDDYLRFARRLKTVVGPHTVALLEAGHSVVLDFPANTRDGRAWFRTVAEEAGAAHRLHFVNSPDDVCLSRIAQRNALRPEGSHLLSAEDFAHVSSFFQAPEPSEGFDIITHVT